MKALMVGALVVAFFTGIWKLWNKFYTKASVERQGTIVVVIAGILSAIGALAIMFVLGFIVLFVVG